MITLKIKHYCYLFKERNYIEIFFWICLNEIIIKFIYFILNLNK